MYEAWSLSILLTRCLQPLFGEKSNRHKKLKVIIAFFFKTEEEAEFRKHFCYHLSLTCFY